MQWMSLSITAASVHALNQSWFVPLQISEACLNFSASERTKQLKWFPREPHIHSGFIFSDVSSVLVSLTLSRDISSPQTQNPLILKAVTITLAAFSHAKWCHQMCSHAVTPISLLISKSSDQIHAREMRWNSPHLSVWPDDNITRRGQRFPAFPSMWRKCSRYCWSAPLPYCFSICRANAALLPSQQYPDLLAPLAYVICTCYCTHTHIHTHRSTLSCFPLSPQTHPRDPAWTEYHTKAWHVCVCCCKCPRTRVEPSVQNGCARLSAVVHRRSETNKLPSSHTLTHTHTLRRTYKNMPYAHDQPITHPTTCLTQCIM